MSQHIFEWAVFEGHNNPIPLGREKFAVWLLSKVFKDRYHYFCLSENTPPMRYQLDQAKQIEKRLRTKIDRLLTICAEYEAYGQSQTVEDAREYRGTDEAIYGE